MDNIRQYLEKGILLSPELAETPLPILEGHEQLIVLDQHLVDVINKKGKIDFDGYYLKKVQEQKSKKTPIANNADQAPTVQEPKKPGQSKVEIIESFQERNTKIEVKDFVSMYNSRYILLQNILRQRQELEGATAIRKILAAEKDTKVSFIGSVLDKGLTKNDNIILTLEDPTGIIKAVLTKSNKEMYEAAKDITPDEILGVSGTKADGIVFLNSVVFPDVPLGKELKKSPLDESALFIGDLHIGAKAFLRPQFEKFISWLKGEHGTPSQIALVKKIKYLFIIGDIVDGIGIYPDHEKDLEIKDIYKQYGLFSDYIKSIPKDISVILCPGNHDSCRIAEPQPAIPREVLPDLYDMDNVYFVSSPSNIRIGATAKFVGFDVLIYHGFSFPYYADAIESIRQRGGLENTDNIMTYLLKKRHLAPTHGSTQYQLGYDTDPLVIKTIPDFFVTGHIHRASLKNYKNTTLINSACWISQTDYQEKRGLVPQPCRAIYVDLGTRESKILNFEEHQ